MARPVGRRRLTARDVLSAEEYVVVLRRLLGEHQELQADANEIAKAILLELRRDEVAEEVRSALESVSTGEVAARSGRRRGRGYVDPSEAAWELLDAAVDG